MVLASPKTFYATLGAGAVFIVVGIAAAIYSSVPVDVSLDGTLRPGLTDVLSPDMNTGNTASIMINRSVFDVTIEDPDRQVLKSEKSLSTFSYDLTAQKSGEHRITITNTGSEELEIKGHAQTKGSPLGFSGPMMLLITGVIVIGMSLRFKNR